MMDWFPVVFIVFKVLVLGTGMFFAVKWHYEKGKMNNEKRMALRRVGKVFAVFALLLVGLLFATFILSRTLGLDLAFP